MSFRNYIEALELISEHEELLDSMEGCTEELVKKAEKRLNLSFPKSYRDFLLKFGTMNFGSEEFYGIVQEDFDNSSVPDAIWYTLRERLDSGLPDNLFIIYDTGSEEVFCLDFNRTTAEGEPAVVVFVPIVEVQYQTNELISEDFGAFLLQRIRFELEME